MSDWTNDDGHTAREDKQFNVGYNWPWIVSVLTVPHMKGSSVYSMLLIKADDHRNKLKEDRGLHNTGN